MDNTASAFHSSQVELFDRAGAAAPSGGSVPAMAPATTPAAPPALAMLSGAGAVVCDSLGQPVPRGPAETLGQRVRAFLRDVTSASLVAGALPYDRAAPDLLSGVAQAATALPPPARPDVQPPATWRLRAEPLAGQYADAVAGALERLGDGSGELRKLVLARTMRADTDGTIDLRGLLHRLHTDPAVMAFLVPLPPGADGQPRVLAGATPELLVARTGRQVTSHPLAGSARREADAAADGAARASLLASAKDRREHALVPEFILDTLAPHCRSLSAGTGAEVTATRTMWHLGTRIEGELRDPDTTAADLAGLLHPTPAVCGVPRDAAAALIRTLEPIDRGFYAGAVGWCDRAGDGAWHVALRCAEISGHTARLYAGAGIVPGSTPDSEVAETRAKFRAMLHALGADDAVLPA